MFATVFLTSCFSVPKVFLSNLGHPYFFIGGGDLFYLWVYFISFDFITDCEQSNSYPIEEKWDKKKGSYLGKIISYPYYG